MRAALLALMIFGTPLSAFSQAPAAEDEGFPQTGARVAADRAKARLYAGGREEQDLEVQTGLPHPSKSPDAPMVDTAIPADSQPAHD